MTTVSIGLKGVNGVNTFHNSYGAQKNNRNKKISYKARRLDYFHHDYL